MSHQSTLSGSICYLSDRSDKARVSQTKTLDQSGDTGLIHMDQSDMAGSIHNRRNLKKLTNLRLQFFDSWDRCQIKGAQLCSSPISMSEAQESSLTLKNTHNLIGHKENRELRYFTPPNSQRLILCALIENQEPLSASQHSL